MGQNRPGPPPVQVVMVGPPPEAKTPLDRLRWYRDFMRKSAERQAKPIVLTGPQEAINMDDLLSTIIDTLLGHKHPNILEEGLQEDGPITEQIKTKIQEHVENAPHLYRDGSSE